MTGQDVPAVMAVGGCVGSRLGGAGRSVIANAGAKRGGNRAHEKHCGGEEGGPGPSGAPPVESEETTHAPRMRSSHVWAQATDLVGSIRDSPLTPDARCKRRAEAVRLRGSQAAAQSEVERNLRALAITETELKLIAAAAMIGLRSTPNAG